MNSAFSKAALILHERITHRQILARLEALNRSQWLSRDELLKLQQAKLQRLVEYADQYVPYYQRTFKQAGFSPDDLKRDPACFARLPILTKDIIRKNIQDMLTTEPERRRRMSQLSTSGSTGQPLIFMQDYEFRDAVTADIQRHMGWAGWKLGELQAIIWGAPLKTNYKRKLRTYFINKIWNRFQINAFQMSDSAMAAFANRIVHQKPRILFGYATSLHQFAQYIRRSPYEGITFDGIFSSAETLLPPVRLYIEETFRSKIFDRYGTLDVGGVACECEAHGGYHISVENNFVEVLPNEFPFQTEQVGEIIVTNLNNLGMPFIRYSIGDAGVLREGASCPCGRSSPMLAEISGRLTEMFQTRDGRTVRAAFSGGFRCLAHPSIKQFQVIQKSLDQMVVRLVPETEVPSTVLEEISRSIQLAFGENVRADFEFPKEIPSLPSGKHQYVVSELKQQ